MKDGISLHSISIFSEIGKEVWTMIWRWALRRHPSKGKRWVKARYFEQRQSRDWVFACPNTPVGLRYRPTLFDLTSIGIKRLTKIRGQANPFDPTWAKGNIVWMLEPDQLSGRKRARALCEETRTHGS